MNDTVAALLLALAAENAELREQLVSAQDMLVETPIDAGNMHALVEAMRAERDAWREEAGRLQTGSACFLLNPMGAGRNQSAWQDRVGYLDAVRARP
ncbi:hypothetical protein [Methylobacterium sp. J-026]|uniref:hypothetical protein n=1 Tax=Methylobacterium sp. J-026 TaxID=2836624 RepID=UPI0028C408EC|nr:hypothetical protein [Methylobacterium sp. J-026]